MLKSPGTKYDSQWPGWIIDIYDTRIIASRRRCFYFDSVHEISHVFPKVIEFLLSPTRRKVGTNSLILVRCIDLSCHASDTVQYDVVRLIKSHDRMRSGVSYSVSSCGRADKASSTAVWGARDNKMQCRWGESQGNQLASSWRQKKKKKTVPGFAWWRSHKK